MRSRESVRGAHPDNRFRRAFDEPGGLLRRILDSNDLVILTVHDQGRDIELLEILCEIGLRECLDAFVCVLKPSPYSQSQN